MNPLQLLLALFSSGASRTSQRTAPLPQQSSAVRAGLAALLLCAGFWFALNGTPTQASSLRAGAARVDITPTEPVMLAGYESRKELSKGVHDPLSARAIAFEQDGERLVVVSLDNLGFYNATAEPLRQAVLAGAGLKPSELLLCAIHSHSAPTLTLNVEKGHSNNVAYTQGLEEKLTALVRKALAQLGPIEIGVGSGSSPVGVNRREVVLDESGKAKIVLGRNPLALTDREVQVLKLVRPPGEELAAVLFAYATHSTSLGPKNYLVSGDIHGLAEQFLENYLRPAVVASGFAGASGNIDPWVRVLPEFRTTNAWIPEPVLLGTMLGEEVARVLEGTKCSMQSGPIKTALKTVELPGKPAAPGSAPIDSKASMNLTVGRVGDIAFVGYGGEVFNEIGKAIKNESPFRATFILTHCNGAAGYLPTRPSYVEGGYEVQSSPFGPGADDQLIESTLQMLRELK